MTICFVSSCSKDDEPGNSPEPTIKMRPTSIVWYNEGDATPFVKYENIEYFESLKVRSWVKDWGMTTKTYEYTYNTNSIIRTETSSDGNVSFTSEDTFIISNGKIVREDEDYYEYEGDLLIRQASDGYISETIYAWDKGNITERIINGDDGSAALTCSYTYTDYPMYVWIQTEYEGGAEEMFEESDPFLVRQGYYGKIPNYWVKQMDETYITVNSGRKDVARLDYVFNENGYPTKISRSITYGNQSPDRDYLIITWEKY